MFTPDRKFGYGYVKLGNSREEWFINSTSQKCERDMEQNCASFVTAGVIYVAWKFRELFCLLQEIQASVDERWSMSYTSCSLLQLFSNICTCVHMRRAQIFN
jgi:hypothetical protein